MRLDFVKMNPCGNTTVLILTPVPRTHYYLVAAELMKPENLSAEQVGFLEPASFSGSGVRLEMMGGEFCGNAARCFAAWLAERNYPGIVYCEEKDSWLVPLEISGSPQVLTAQVKKKNAGRFTVELPMPVPKEIKHVKLRESGDNCSIIIFDGITHMIVWDGIPSEDRFRYFLEKLLVHAPSRQEAAGILFYNEEKRVLTPVVCVPSVGSVVWESSCGSGTVAVACAIAEKKKQSVRSLMVSQPGGVLGVDIVWDQRVRNAVLYGELHIVAQGTADICL